jgi:hypothetical protein
MSAVIKLYNSRLLGTPNTATTITTTTTRKNYLYLAATRFMTSHIIWADQAKQLARPKCSSAAMRNLVKTKPASLQRRDGVPQ